MNNRMKTFYMIIAEDCAKMSRAKRLQVGAAIVKNDNIISFSWNGMPAGWDNNCEDKVWDCGSDGWLNPDTFNEQYPYTGWHEKAGRVVRYGLKTKPEVLHAETNALMKLAKCNESGSAASIFITHAPCLQCAKGIYQAGIKEVYFKNTYRSSDGIEFLEKCEVHVEQLKENKMSVKSTTQMTKAELLHALSDKNRIIGELNQKIDELECMAVKSISIPIEGDQNAAMGILVARIKQLESIVGNVETAE